ncbi:Gypsy retrotransposon integrase-like protein 1 [Eumeta japonica]|uniref:RNA-directed DNA polymerase n=1 Tax=Eumeta variegata TaxID=151549 RepID=A0A4C1TNM9_EUMVA|nr:Gypsy retrotransposon integrase-like protein 1 [Eumeta japonica]
MEEVSVNVEGMVDLESSAFGSDDYLELVSTIETNSERLPDLKVLDGMAYKRVRPYDGLVVNKDFTWKLWIPQELTKSVNEKAHNSHQAAHGGVGKTLRRIKEYLYWPNLNTQVHDYVQNCQACKESKPSNVTLRPPMGAETVMQRPFQRIHIDFLGPYPFQKRQQVYFCCSGSSYQICFIEGFAKGECKNVVRFLIAEVFHKFGEPEVVVSDNRKQFVGKEFADLMKNFGIRHLRTAVYASQANASERVNQSVLAAVRSQLQDNQSEWDKHLSEIVFSLRSSLQSSIGVTPYFDLFGVNMTAHGSVYGLARKLKSLEDPELHVITHSEKLSLLR